MKAREGGIYGDWTVRKVSLKLGAFFNLMATHLSDVQRKSLALDFQ